MNETTKRNKAKDILAKLVWVGDADVWVGYPSGRVQGPIKVAEAAYILAGNPRYTIHVIDPREDAEA